MSNPASKNPIDKIAWVHIENKTLLTTRSRGKDVCYIPGGKREKGESDRQTLLREIKEELSVDLKIETVGYLGTFHAQAHGHPEGVMVKMACYTGDYEGTLKPASEIEEFRWVTRKDRFDCAPVDQVIMDWLLDREMID